MGRKNNRKQIHTGGLPMELVKKKPKRMEIWYAYLPMHKGQKVQGGARPVVIVSNDISNEKSGIVTVVPLTSKMKRLDMPTHIQIPFGAEGSVVLAEQIMTMDQRFLDRKIGMCDREPEIELAMLAQLGF